MVRQLGMVLYVAVMVVVIVGVDLLFFRNQFLERLICNVGIVVVFAAFYLALNAVFLRRTPTVAPLETVESIDLQRYQGRWFEIAHYPAPFEHATDKNTTAQYTALPDGRIQVVNQTISQSGSVRVARAIASVADPQTNAKLKVKFSPFLPSGDYWVIDLAPDYSYAVVGDPRRRFLWILSRTTPMPEPVFNQISARLIEQHYDPARLINTTQE